MDPSEHQDSNHRKDDEDNDGCHDDDSQCGHTVAGQLISCVGRKTFIMCDFSSDYQVFMLDIFRTQYNLIFKH